MKFLFKSILAFLILLNFSVKSQQFDLNRTNGDRLISSLKLQKDGTNDNYKKESEIGTLIDNKYREKLTEVFLQELSKTTELENNYSVRAGQNLKLQGYDFLINNLLTNRLGSYWLSGEVQDNYILGYGDEISIILRGSVNEETTYKIKNDGLIALDFGEPILAAGISFEQLKKKIIQLVDQSLIETKVYISLVTFKQITITVVGEVNIPGNHKLQGSSSIIEALLSSGGIKKTGSLRQINIIRNNKTYYVDLYNFIYGTGKEKEFNFNLSHGDIVYVPTTGKTTAILGNISKKGIYELSKKGSSLDEILKITGSLSFPGEKKITLIKVNKDGSEKFHKNPINDILISNGDIINVNSHIKKTKEAVKVFGSVTNEAIFSYSDHKYLSSILKNISLVDNETYLFSLLIKSTNQENLKTYFHAENFIDVLTGKSDVKLQPNDEIFILSKSNIDSLTQPDFIKALNGKYIRSDSNERCIPLEQLNKKSLAIGETKVSPYYSISKAFESLNIENDNQKANDIFDSRTEGIVIKDLVNFEKNDLFEKKLEEEKFKQALLARQRACPEIFKNHTGLLNAILDHAVVIRGPIDNPGVYVSDQEGISENLLNYVNIPLNQAIIAKSGLIADYVNRYVIIEGAIRFPQNIPLDKNQKISSLLSSSLVFLNDTYPFFATVNRLNPSTGSPSTIVFSPSNIVTKKKDFDLFPGDMIKIFSKKEIALISQMIQQRRLQKELHDNSDLLKKVSDLQDIKELIFGYKISLEDLDNVPWDDKRFPLAKAVKKDNIEETKEVNNTELQNQNMTTPEDDQLAYQNETFSIDNPMKDLEETNDNVNILHSKNISNNFTADNSSYIINTKEFENTFKNINKKDLELIEPYLVNIFGAVSYSGLYPVGGETKVNSLIDMAGGFIPDANTDKIEVINIEKSNEYQGFVYPGSSIFVPYKQYIKDTITLKGGFQEVRDIGYRNGLKINDIIYDFKQFRDDAYLYFATIERISKKDNSKIFIPFAPSEVISKKQKITMNKGDIITIYNNDQISLLIDAFIDNKDLTPDLSLVNNNFLPNPSGSVEELVKRLSVNIEGEISKPGAIILGGLFSLDKLISISGGFTSLSNRENISVTFPFLKDDKTIALNQLNLSVSDNNFDDIFITPGSSIRVPKLESEMKLGFVRIDGEVNQPGNYRIREGDTIYEIIKRANGLTKSASMLGLVFAREDEKLREEKSLNKLKRELNKSLSLAIETSVNNNFSVGDIAALRELALEAAYFKPIGRVVGDFSKISILKNTYVLKGDKIFIPKKSTSVSVVGEIMSPGSLIWEKGLDTKDYIKLAAGFTELADKNKVFIIEPNGRAKQSGSLWSSSSNTLPGSTIVVPRRIQLSSNLEKISAVTSIVYQLTLSLAGIDSVLNN